MINAMQLITAIGGATVVFLSGQALAAPPLNDNLANATVIAPAGGVVGGTNVDATKETGEANHAGNAGGASVWWSWTAPSSGLTAFSTSGSPIDTLMAIYTGSSYPLTLVAENDDENIGSGIITSRVSFSAVAGTTYRIAVDGFDGEEGAITLEKLSGVSAPPNDNLANAITATGISGSATGSNVDATKETGELEIVGNPGGASVWWSWVAPVSDTVVFNTHGSTFDTIMGIYTGATHPLTLVVEGDDSMSGTSSEVSFNAIAGTSYKIAVDGFDGTTGDVSLGWSATVPQVSAITRTGNNPTSTTSVAFAVTFTEAVTGVNASDFAITATGITGASVTAVTGSGASYAVTVNSGTGSGTLRLDLIDNDSIVDGGNTALGGTGAGNGNFTSGQVFTIDKTPPVVASIAAVSGKLVDITFTESQALNSASAVTAANYTVSGAGKGTVADHPDSVALQMGTTYRLTWNTGGMINGQPVTITVTNVRDTAGNLIGMPNSGSNLALPVTLSAFEVE